MRIKRHKQIPLKRAQQVCDAVWLLSFYGFIFRANKKLIHPVCELRKVLKTRPLQTQKIFLVPVAIAKLERDPKGL